MALGSGICGLLDCDPARQPVKVYDCAALQRLLGIGRDRAYSIMKSHGFRAGDRALRISEPQLAIYIKEQRNDQVRLDK